MKKLIVLLFVTFSLTGNSLSMHKIEKWVEKATECYEQEDYECLLAYGQKIINHHPEIARGYYFRGLYYWYNGNHDLALLDLQKAHQLDTEEMDYLLDLSTLYYDDDQYEQAEHYLQKAYRLDAENVDVLILLADCEYLQDQETHNTNYLEQLEAIAPDNYYLHYRKGVNHYEAGQFTDAIYHFEQAIADDSTYDIGYFYRAMALEEIDADKAAMNAIKQAIALNDEEEDYYLLQGYLLMKEEKFSRAIEVLEKGLALNPEDASTWYNLALSHLWLENYHAALESIEQCFIYGDEPDEYYYARGDIKYYRYGDTAGCADWQKALELGKLEAVEDLINYCPDYEVRTSL